MLIRIIPVKQLRALTGIVVPCLTKEVPALYLVFTSSVAICAAAMATVPQYMSQIIRDYDTHDLPSVGGTAFTI